MNTPLKMVGVLTGSNNQGFIDELISRFEQRGCAVRFSCNYKELLHWLRNPAVVGLIIDNYNPTEVDGDGVRKIIRVLRAVHPRPNVLVLKPQHDADDLLAAEDAHIWVHDPDDFTEVPDNTMDECFDHVACGTPHKHIHAVVQ
jgi:hypothetical protein